MINQDRPLRIAFFTDGFPVTSEPFIALQAAELLERGHDVRIFGLSNVKASQSSSSERVKALIAGRYANARWPKSFASRLAAVPAASFRTARKSGFQLAALFRPMIFRRTWRDFSAVFQAELVAGEAPFDILHCHFATLAEHVFKLKAAGLLSGRTVVHFRGYDITEVVHAFGPNIYNPLWEKADRFVANCEHFRDRAVSIGCPADRIDVVGSGIELASFEYRPPLPPGPGPVRIIGVGRLSARKGFHTLIDALAILNSAGVQAQLTLIGDGEERKSLEMLAQDRGIDDRVFFKGAMPHARVANELAASHIFAAPSETSPKGGLDAPTNTIKEAMAIGVPVCATKHGGIPELVEEPATGVLAKEGDPLDLSMALQRLIVLAPDWPTITAAARARVEERYSTQYVTDQLLRVYRMALIR